MEDEAEIFEGLRSQFPLSFGKQSKSETPLELIHNATRRAAAAATTSTAVNSDKPSASTSSDKANAFPSLSSSSKGWLDSLKNSNPRNPKKKAKEDELIGPPRRPVSSDGTAIIGPPRPPPGSGVVDEDDEPVIGPPRPRPGGDGDDDDDEPMVGPPRPPPGGEGEDDDGGSMIGPPRPPPGGMQSDSDEDMDEEDENSGYRIPLSNEIVLKGHTKVVAALAVDHSGSRVLSGSYDYTVRMYDFQGMNSRLQSFRQLEPFEGHQIRGLSWSPTADRFLCVTGSAQAKIYDRDGLTLGEFVKGDMYIRDLKNTKGHISGLTCGEWHPKAKETILTSSEDGSLRIWDVNDFKSQKQVIKPKLSRPGRVPVTTCSWDREGKRIAGGIGDGSIQVWNIKAGWGSRPDIYVANGHTDDITGIKFSSDGLTLLSRSFDGSLKVWDLRQMKEALQVFDDLPNHYAQTNITFSPDEQLFLTGTSIERESTTGGLLCIYDRAKLELVSRVGISPTFSVVQCAWHPRLNQIFATVGDRHEGGTHILYDPTISERGALVCVARAPRKQSVDDFQAQPVIHNPHALPLFRDQPSRKRQREKILKDPLKSHKPELPINGPGHGGRVGSTKGSLLTQYLLKQGGLIKETWMEEDPREAILKYADVAAKDPKFIAPAYAETQPEPVFAKSDSEDEEK
ncbi:WD repeat-containing protein 70 [Sesamum indicum]|uniref:WD repeat-containing protein 70 n=1 Tax=Sesamum indicum TaxID=4182 RepID=A0A6I9THF9_SESIN|nr:WD repeat-containing protein 70 [Sesamum indicum]XP_011080129.1 WD repeat-containing protein 70 [Sesamum indicum]XP_011080130.1 WD repeat-containing protein 70 [Sesamum indicum]